MGYGTKPLPLPPERPKILSSAPDWGHLGAIKPFGQILQGIRRRANVSQKELSQRCGLSFEEICQIENGRRVPSATQLIAIAICLGIDGDLLLLAAKGAATK